MSHPSVHLLTFPIAMGRSCFNRLSRLFKACRDRPAWRVLGSTPVLRAERNNIVLGCEKLTRSIDPGRLNGDPNVRADENGIGANRSAQ
jgi:hypothetical protein